MRTILLLFAATLVLVPALAQSTPPIADAGPERTMYSGSYIILQGTAWDPDDGTIEAWQWGIIDGPVNHDGSLTHAGTPTPRFSANILGAYVISLYVVDSQLEQSAADFTQITVIQNQPPEAVATADPTSGPAPLTVNFDGTGSSDPEVGPLVYDWDFGDGQRGTGPSPTHTYYTPGIYHVALSVTDEGGMDDFDLIDIIVSPTVPVEPTTWGRIKELYQ